MRNKGFTLVELLAVIVVLAIILAIAIPGISNVIESSKISSFENSVKMIIKGIDINRRADSSFDVDGLNADNIDEALGIDNNNYKLLRAAATNDEVYVDIVGQNQWEGLEYHGTINNLSLIKEGMYALAPESCFTFNSATKTITKYNLNNPSCPLNPEIPDTIGGVPVEHLAPGSFITPTEQWCSVGNDFIDVGLNHIHEDGDGHDYCYYEVDWDTPGPLTAVKLPRNLKTVGYAAFMYNLLENVFIPNGVTTIEDDAFEYNVLTEVYLPDSITTMGAWAFSLNNISKINIPRSLTRLDSWVFCWNQLTSMTIPSHITSMGAGVFRGNQYLEKLVVDSANPVYKSVNNGIYTKDGTTLIVGTKVMANMIENTVTTIGDFAFHQMGITGVTIPNSVREIGYAAFEDNNLTSLTIPDGVIAIGPYAFAYNELLTSVTLPDSLIAIEGGVFYGDKLSSITIPSSVETIGAYTFYDNPMTSITMMRANTSIGSYLLINNNNFKSAYENPTTGGIGTYIKQQNGTWLKQ